MDASMDADNQLPHDLDEGDFMMPIAIVGLSCRLPGGITNPEVLLQSCTEQRDVWQPMSRASFGTSGLYHPDPGRNGTSNVRGGYFLEEDPGLFDPSFFNLTGTEARAMDPQQRLLLELSYEALENAGIPMARLSKSDTAVFVGSSCSDYADILQRDPERTEVFESTGTAQTMLANRISYFYDLKGPSVSVDTACSSSLVALHLACNALRLGESRTAIVGGSNLILSNTPLLALSMLRFLSPDGRCYTYDERANGFGRGEGASCLIIKTLAAALEDGDTVRAIIRNTCTSQDGRTSGITLPSGDAQVELIERTYKAAHLDPIHTSYIEAHGTGTPAGDPIEAASLSTVFGRGRPLDHPLMVGSIKSNIGHLEGGSGLAGVVKTVMMLEGGVILPNFDFRKENPRIPLQKWRLKVPTALQSWLPKKMRRASVNNFGFGGSNAHAIIDDACSYFSSRELPGKLRKRAQESALTNGHLPTEIDQPRDECSQVFVLSSSDEASGARQVKALAKYLESQSSEHGGELLDDLAYSLSERRSLLPWKAAFPAVSLGSLHSTLHESKVKFFKPPTIKNLGFIFTGQGAQWRSMGFELIHQYPAFQKSLAATDRYCRGLGATFSIFALALNSFVYVASEIKELIDYLDELSNDDTASDIHSPLFSQTLTTALQIALVDLMSSWNVRPVRVTGHSSGEIAAAYSAGALAKESAIAIAYHRGRAAQTLKSLRQGAMLAVGLSEESVRPLVASLTQGTCSIACINSPASVTISGDKPAIAELQATLEERPHVFARLLKVDVAYHSHHMTDVADEYRTSLGKVELLGNGPIEFYSSVFGKKVDATELGAEYWVSNMVNSVRFQHSVQSLLSSPEKQASTLRGEKPAVHALVEIGPHSALQAPLKQIIQDSPEASASHIPYMTALVRSKDAVATSHKLVSQLFTHGYPVDLQAVNFPSDKTSLTTLVDLPSYPWNHSKAYWAESHSHLKHGEKETPRSDFLGIRVRSSSSSEPSWRNILRPSEIPWVHHHTVQMNTVYPAAGFLAMAIEAEHQQATARKLVVRGYRFRDVSITRALLIPSELDGVETLFSLRPHNESTRALSEVWDEFCISSSTDGSIWTEHCRGLISVEKHSHTNEVTAGHSVHAGSPNASQMRADFDRRCTTQVEGPDVYKALTTLGLDFGTLFANMDCVRTSSDKCTAEVRIPDTAAIMPAGFEYPFVVHPATLDSCIHAVFPINNRHNHDDQGTPLPTYIDELFIAHDIPREPNCVFSVYARSEAKDTGKKVENGYGHQSHSLFVFDKNNTRDSPVITINGLILIPLPKADVGSTTIEEKVYYQTRWQKDPDLLTPKQVSELGRPFRRPLEDTSQLEMVQQAAFYYADRAINEISAHQISSMDPHHRRYFKTMAKFCQSVHERQPSPFQTSGWLQADETQRNALCAKVSALSYGILLCPIGENLVRVLRNEVDPLSLMMQDDRLETYYRANQSASQCHEQAAVYIQQLGFKNPNQRILEIGAGTGGATLPILQWLSQEDGLPPNFARYDFTDLSPAFFDKAVKKLDRWSDYITFKKLDIEIDPLSQGYEAKSYDLIVAANVLHATSCVERTLERVRSLLKPGGKLVMIELTVDTMAVSLIFGSLPGWWIGTEESRQDSPLLTEAEWGGVLEATGFTGVDAVLWDMAEAESHHSSVIVSSATAPSQKSLPPVTIVVDDETPAISAGPLQGLLSGAGVDYNISTLTECVSTDRVLIVLCDLTRSVLRNPAPGDYDAIKRILLNSAGVLWVTGGALLESSRPDASLVTGLARTIRAENGDTLIVTLDLDTVNPSSSLDRAEAINTVFSQSFSSHSEQMANMETEYAERLGYLMIPRIIEDKVMTDFVAANTGVPVHTERRFCQKDCVLKAEIQIPGLLDSIVFVEQPKLDVHLPDHHVDVEVKACGMNFRDVMSALGQIEPYPLGCECSGIVTAVGSLVEDLHPGDHVIVTAKAGCFSNFLRVPTKEVELIPAEMAFDVAAALPIVYLTAYWAVYKIGRVAKGETVLIHAASGGLGQALINLCMSAGAEIFATVGSLEKKNLLMAEFKIPEDHIFSSRDTAFYAGIMRATDERGVDVVMNSLSGEALRLSWQCIAPFGRFVELGKRDFTLNTRLEMRKFANNVSFTGLDLPLDSRHTEKAMIWKEIMRLFEAGLIKVPSPITRFGIADLETALRRMQAGKHMGKLVLVPQPGEKVRVLPLRNDQMLLHSNASYLLIGGLGGIGRAIAHWMVGQGAKHLIFASPSGAEKVRAKETVARLKDQGTEVAVFKCDISRDTDLKHVLEQCKADMPPIRGILHAAMVPKADLMSNLTLDDYNSIMRPKVDGIWNLHHAFLEPDSLDFFIMLSSIVGLSGNPSQAPYTAASVFLDAFAEYRTHQNLPAVTFDFGRIVDIGIVADSISARRGVRDLWSRDVHEEEVMAMIRSAVVMPLRKPGSASSHNGLKPWAPEADPVYQTPLFSHFRRAAMEKNMRSDAEASHGVEGSATLREQLRQATTMQDALTKVGAAIVAKAASLLMLTTNDISSDRSLADYGMDSLVAVEMRNWILRETDVALPILELLENTPLTALTRKVITRSRLVNATVLG